MLPDDDLHGDLGRLDAVSMDEIRSACTGFDGRVENAGFPNLADPQVLKIWFSDGTDDATDGRFDVKWYRKGYYSFHYTDSTGRNFRWDYHPKAGAPDKHFHPPPDAPRIQSRRAFPPWTRRSSLGLCTSCGVRRTIPAVSID
jgi:hypothetical protein